MKKRFFWALCALAMLATPVFAQVEEEETEENDCAIDVYLADNDGPMTNLRDAPRGKVIQQLPNGVYTLCLGENRNGWWKIVDFWDMEEESEDGNPVILDPEKEYWVHYSVVGTGTRNYGGERWCLRAKPSEKSKATYYFKDEITLHPMEVRGEWVKVKTMDGKHTGWILIYNLCGNPLTNCC